MMVHFCSLGEQVSSTDTFTELMMETFSLDVFLDVRTQNYKHWTQDGSVLLMN